MNIKDRIDIIQFLKYNNNMATSMQNSDELVKEIDEIFEKAGIQIISDECLKNKSNDIVKSYTYNIQALPDDGLSKLYDLINNYINHLNFV
jgi:hypothetical protein